MIDRQSRDRAADLVEAFWGGRITNTILVESWPASADPGVGAVEDFVWPAYDDFREHRIDEGLAADPELSLRIARCIAFLRSDEHYTWPRNGTILGVWKVPRWAVLASLGLLSFWNRFTDARMERYRREMSGHGDLDAWPFAKRRS